LSSSEEVQSGRRASHRIFQAVAAGVVCGFLAIVLSISFGNLLLPESMRDHVPVAIGMALFSTMVIAAISAITSPILGAVAIVEEIPVVAIAGPAGAIAISMAGTAPEEDILVTIVVAAALATLATGLTLLVLGFFRLGRLIRFVPFPVIAGFLAGTGWLILQGGLSVTAGVSVDFGSLGAFLDPLVAVKTGIAVAFAGLIILVQSRLRSALVLPAMIFAALVAYNAWVVLGDVPLAVLRDEGWVVPMAGEGLWPPIRPADIASVRWDHILPTAIMLPAILIITVMALLMNATGIELDSGREVDLDRELRSVGLQNLVSGLGGGMPGYPAVSLSLLADRLGAAHRLVGVIVAMLAGAALFLGEFVLNLVPTPLLGSLLIWVGGSLMFQWLVRSLRRLAAWEYAIVLLIFVVIAGVGFPQGVFAGLIAAFILFVVEYGRVDSVRQFLTGRDYQSTFSTSEAQRDSLREFGDAILIARLQGFIFFGTSDRLRKNLEDRLRAGPAIRFLLIDFHRVSGVDSSAVASFLRLGQVMSRSGVNLVLSGMRESVSRPLLRGGLEHARGNVRIEPDIDHGLLWCEERLLAKVAPALETMRSHDAVEIAFGIVKDRPMAEQLVRYFESVSLPEGAILMEQGTPSDAMYFVESGRAAVRMQSPGNSGVRLATVGPGAVVGEVAFYLGQPRTASIIAESPMHAWRLSRADLLRLQAEVPLLALRFHEGLAAMLAGRVSATNRLVGFLAD